MDFGSRLGRAMVWGTGGLVAVVLSMAGYTLVAGGGDGDRGQPRRPGASHTAPGGGQDTGPQPTYAAPQEWSEPQRWASLPRGAQVDQHGNEVTFPHTEQGAVAMLTAVQTTAAEGDHSLADEQMSIYASYMSRADRSRASEAKVRQAAYQADARLRQSLGAPAEGALPHGAYMRTAAVGFQIIESSPDEIWAYVLNRVTTKASQTATEDSAYSRTLMAARWDNGDWKLSATATARAAQHTQEHTPPKMAAPGDTTFNTAGWTAIREAS